MPAHPLSFNLGLPEVPITENQELWQELLKVYNATRQVAYMLDTITGHITPPTADWAQLGVGNATHSNPRFYMPAYENLSYGNTIEIYNAGAGVGQAKKGTSGKVVGFCSAIGGTTIGNITEVTIFGKYPAFAPSTLTPGTFYGQSATPGVIGTPGQVLGFALSDTTFYFLPQL